MNDEEIVLIHALYLPSRCPLPNLWSQSQSADLSLQLVVLATQPVYLLHYRHLE